MNPHCGSLTSSHHCRAPAGNGSFGTIGTEGTVAFGRELAASFEGVENRRGPVVFVIFVMTYGGTKMETLGYIYIYNIYI